MGKSPTFQDETNLRKKLHGKIKQIKNYLIYRSFGFIDPMPQKAIAKK